MHQQKLHENAFYWGEIVLQKLQSFMLIRTEMLVNFHKDNAMLMWKCELKIKKNDELRGTNMDIYAHHQLLLPCTMEDEEGEKRIRF